MVTNRGIKELQRNITKDNVGFTHMAGAYVNVDKDIVTRIDTRFLSLEEGEFNKYLEIAQECLKGRAGEKILTLGFQRDAVDTKMMLEQLSNPENGPEMQEDIYDRIISNYGYVGNYLILLFWDNYDVVKQSAAGQSQDESEDVYSYVLCAICPVGLTKSGLECRDGKIQLRERDWVVGKPDVGFIYPAFVERSSDYSKVMYYCSDPKAPGHDVMENVLGCRAMMTAAEHKKAFEEGIHLKTQSEERTNEILMEINAELRKMVDAESDDEALKSSLGVHELKRIMKEHGISDEETEEITKDYATRYELMPLPKIEWLYDKKYVAAYDEKQRKDRMRKLLNMSVDELAKRGEKGLAQEIKEFLEKTR